MPPKTNVTKVQPARAASSSTRNRGSAGVTVDASKVVEHERPEYNEYDLDGRRQMEAKGRFAKFKQRLAQCWTSSFVWKKVQNFVKAYKEHKRRAVEQDELGAGPSCCLGFLVLIAQILLNASLILTIYWVVNFHSSSTGAIFAWRGGDPSLQFNWHPILMVTGLIYFVGQAALTYRSCRCCKRIWNKILHTIFHMLAIPCVILGFVAALDSHNLRRDRAGRLAPIPNFYSLHSWMGLITLAMFGLQFVVGLFSFLLLLCCERATAAFRSCLVPVHAAVGVAILAMAVATACVGLTEKAFFSLSVSYSKWVLYATDPYFNATTALSGVASVGPVYTSDMFYEALMANIIGFVLVLLLICIIILIFYPGFRPNRARILVYEP